MGQTVVCNKKKQLVEERVHPVKDADTNQNSVDYSQSVQTNVRPNSANQAITSVQMNKHDRAYSVSSNATNIEIFDQQRHSANQVLEGDNDLNNRLASIHEEQGGSNQGSLISQGKKGSLDKRDLSLQKKTLRFGSDERDRERAETAQQAAEHQRKEEEITESEEEGKAVQQPDEEEEEEDQEQDEDEQYEEDQEEDQDIDYVQGELIQEGTRVYSALNVLNGQLLAVKIVCFYELEESEMDNAFETLDMLLEIEHENIHEIITYDTSKGETTLTVVMPFESGGSIKWLLQKFNKFSPHLAAIFMKQILEGLAHLHQKGLVHQNLKTSNVLVDENANAKLSDINIQGRYDLSSYSAPECFEGGVYTTFSDVWSAGCIFIEMLTQKNPWQEGKETPTIEDIRAYLKKGRLFSLQSINLPDIQQVLKLIFKKNPEERLSAQQLLDLEFFKQKIFETNEYKQSLFPVGQSQMLNNFNMGSSIVASQAMNNIMRSQHKKPSHYNQHQQHPNIPTGRNRRGSTDPKDKDSVKNVQSIQRTPPSNVRQNDINYSQALSKLSNSNSNNTLSSQSKGSFKKLNTMIVSQTESMAKRKSLILRRLMNRVAIADEDIQQSIGIEDIKEHQLSYNDLKMVIHKKTNFTHIIEEEDGNEEKPAPRTLNIQNPLVKMGLLRSITKSQDVSNSNRLDYMGDFEERKTHNPKKPKLSSIKSLYSSQNASKWSNSSVDRPSIAIQKEKKKSRFVGSFNSRDDHSQDTPRLYGQDQERNDDIVRQLVGNPNKKDTEYLEDQINRQFYQLSGTPQKQEQRQDSEIIMKLTGAGNAFEDRIARQFYSSEKSDMKPASPKNELADLEAKMNMQFYSSATSNNKSQAQLPPACYDQDQLDAKALEKLMMQQFYQSEQFTPKPEANEPANELDELKKLEQLMALQYMSSYASQVPEVKQEPPKTRDQQAIEDLIGGQFYSSQKKQPSDDEKQSALDFQKLENMIGDQFYDHTPTHSEVQVDPDELLKQQLEKMMAQQYFNYGQSEAPKVESKRLRSLDEHINLSGGTSSGFKDSQNPEYIEYSFGQLLLQGKRVEDSNQMSINKQELSRQLRDIQMQYVPEEDETVSGNVSPNTRGGRRPGSKGKQKLSLSRQNSSTSNYRESDTDGAKRKKQGNPPNKKNIIVKKRKNKNLAQLDHLTTTNQNSIQNSVKLSEADSQRLSSNQGDLALSLQIFQQIKDAENQYIGEKSKFQDFQARQSALHRQSLSQTQEQLANIRETQSASQLPQNTDSSVLVTQHSQANDIKSLEMHDEVISAAPKPDFPAQKGFFFGANIFNNTKNIEELERDWDDIRESSDMLDLQCEVIDFRYD